MTSVKEINHKNWLEHTKQLANTTHHSGQVQEPKDYRLQPSKCWHFSHFFFGKIPFHMRTTPTRSREKNLHFRPQTCAPVRSSNQSRNFQFFSKHSRSKIIKQQRGGKITQIVVMIVCLDNLWVFDIAAECVSHRKPFKVWIFIRTTHRPASVCGGVEN